MTSDRAYIAELPVMQSHLVEQSGWAGITQCLSRSSGRLLILDGDKPEAVVLSVAEYAKLTNAVGLHTGTTASRPEVDGTDSLQLLRERFDARLASLNEPGAGESLRSI